MDTASAIDSENEWPPLGAISMGPDGVQLQVAMKDHHGFTDKVGLKLGLDLPEIAPGLRVSFTRWAFQFGESEHAQFHWIEGETEK